MVPRVFVAGPVSENLLIHLDRLPDPVPQMMRARAHRRTIGGTSAGKALNLAGLGAKVSLSTVVGTDPAGQRVLDTLRQERVELFAELVEGPTEQHVNLMGPRGGRVSIYLEIPDAPSSPPSGPALEALAAADVAMIDLADHARPWLSAAADLGVPIWVDLHDYDGIDEWHAAWRDAGAVVFCNDDRLDDPETFLRGVVAGGARAAVATRGAAGAMAIDPDGRVDVPAEPVSVLDTNGAGDAFAAGFLLASLAGGDLRESMMAGTRQAARCVASWGLAPGVEP
jgi:sugar/nucleoside kinase (ribokinase family)